VSRRLAAVDHGSNPAVIEACLLSDGQEIVRTEPGAGAGFGHQEDGHTETLGGGDDVPGGLKGPDFDGCKRFRQCVISVARALPTPFGHPTL